MRWVDRAHAMVIECACEGDRACMGWIEGMRSARREGKASAGRVMEPAGDRANMAFRGTVSSHCHAPGQWPYGRALLRYPNERGTGRLVAEHSAHGGRTQHRPVVKELRHLFGAHGSLVDADVTDTSVENALAPVSPVEVYATQEQRRRGDVRRDARMV
jgi:hypothetical protein